MSAAAEAYEMLATDASLGALIDGRIHAGWLPDEDENAIVKYPCVVFRQTSQLPDEQTHDGMSGWDRPRFAVDCWAEASETDSAYAVAHAIAAEVRRIVRAASFRVDGAQDVPDPQTRLHRVVVDAVLWTDAN